MDVLEAVQKIKNLRTTVRKGKLVDLYPYGLEYLDDVVKLRNQTMAKYFLAQNFDLSREQQASWMELYLANENEVGFIIKDKKGNVIGVMFLYNYINGTLEFGRVVFDLIKTRAAPYVLEATLIVLDLAFDYLNVDTVIAIIKTDNTLVKFVKKMGFEQVETCIVRNEEYYNLQLSKENRTYRNYYEFIQTWINRH